MPKLLSESKAHGILATKIHFIQPPHEFVFTKFENPHKARHISLPWKFTFSQFKMDADLKNQKQAIVNLFLQARSCSKLAALFSDQFLLDPTSKIKIYLGTPSLTPIGHAETWGIFDEIDNTLSLIDLWAARNYLTSEFILGLILHEITHAGFFNLNFPINSRTTSNYLKPFLLHDDTPIFTPTNPYTPGDQTRADQFHRIIHSSIPHLNELKRLHFSRFNQHLDIITAHNSTLSESEKNTLKEFYKDLSDWPPMIYSKIEERNQNKENPIIKGFHFFEQLDKSIIEPFIGARKHLSETLHSEAIADLIQLFRGDLNLFEKFFPGINSYLATSIEISLTKKNSPPSPSSSLTLK